MLLLARFPPPISSRTVDTKSACYQIQSSSDKVVVDSSFRLPFEPTGAAREMRTKLRLALRTMRPATQDEILNAAYESCDPSFCDVENVLLYNVGAANFHHLVTTGCQLERSFGIADSAHLFEHRVTYKLEPPSNSVGPWRSRQSLASWDFTAPKLNSETKPEAVWHWTKQQTIEVHATSDDDSPLSLDVEVLPSTSRAPRIASMIKPLLDGMLCAIHSHDGSDLEEIVGRIKARLTDTSAERIERWLSDHTHAALGERQLVRQLVRRFGKGIQWNPADDRLVSIRVSLGKPIAEGTRVVGTLHSCTT